MSSSFADMREDALEEMQRHMAKLGREVASLRRSLARHGPAAYDDLRQGAGDLYEDMWERVSHAMPDIRRGARLARETARDNPIMTTALLAGAAALAVALLSRR